jgi:hypothetical protein
MVSSPPHPPQFAAYRLLADNTEFSLTTASIAIGWGRPPSEKDSRTISYSGGEITKQLLFRNRNYSGISQFFRKKLVVPE